MDSPERRERTNRIAAIAGLALVSLLGCSSEPVDEPTDTGTVSRADVDAPGPTWDVVTVADENVGLHLRLDAHAQTLGLAYYDMTGEESDECTEVGDGAPNRVEWTLHYASSANDGPWTTETITRSPFVGQPSGLSLAFDDDGVAHVATMTGVPEEQIRYCGVNDVGLFRREAPSWTSETAVSSSGEAASGFEPSDYGEVVGYWPALAFDGQNRPAIAYKDVHAGGLQSDDFRRADLEFATRAGGWSSIPVDFGNGAGNYNDLLFDDLGRSTLVTVNPVEATSADERGVWVYRSTDQAGEWSRVRLHNQGTVDGPSVAHAAETLYVLFYEAERGYPRLATLPAAGSFEKVADWTFEDIGDSRYDEGYETSLAVSPDGRLTAAYYRCGRASSGLGNCDAANDGLVFAWRDAGAWHHELVETSSGFCGRGAQLAFAPDGTPIIGYRCEAMGGDGFQTEVRVARRGGPP